MSAEKMLETTFLEPRQIPFDLGGRSAHGREDFLIGLCNKDAVGWIDRWPEWPAPALMLTGPAASGKTHLAAVWAEKTAAQIIKPALLAEQSAETIAARAQHLVIDGVDPWLEDRAAEETLFHLYNMFKEEQRSLLITGRMAPAQVQFAVADLASRLRAAPHVRIHPPDDMLLGSVLIKLFSDRQISPSHDVIKYILPRMERSFSAAHELVALADQEALANRQKISIPLMREVLEKM